MLRSGFGALALLLAALTPSAAAGPGTGDLWLHQGVLDYYEVFKEDPQAQFFAVSTNGLSAGYSHCAPGRPCSATESQAMALANCRAVPIDLPGQCHIFADKSGILWRGEVRELDHQAWLERLYGPATVEEALAHKVRHASGPGAAGDFRVSEAIRRRADFAAVPAGFALASDECLYALEEQYNPAETPNFFLADPTGRYCGYSTGYAQVQEAEAFAAAKAACEAIAPAGAACLVYAVERTLVAQRNL
ncbi:MAG TPA: hypothetical protein VJL84_04145 [Kiloniellales bacterium]|nr:hypothetical protein [Kiloniellales bacterium]